MDPTVKLKNYQIKIIMAELNNVRERVVKALNRVRPYLQSDGGDIDLLDVY